MNPIVFAIVVVVVLGLAGGVILVLASKFMAVYEDPRIAQVAECLAGANCGGCGYAGCADYAKAIVEDGAPTFKCAPGGDKATDAINTIMGNATDDRPSLRATVICAGGENCGTRFDYQGIQTCAAANGIAGGPSALVSGGPGALFWTWVSAFFGMATIYAEAVLAQHYRTTVNGHVTGGPAFYIRAAFKGKGGKVLATVFSVLIILALGFMGNMVQSNSIGDAFHNAFGVNRLVVGVIVAAIAAFIFLGGVQRIAAVTEKVVPVMAAFYILGCIAILVINAKALPGALAQVFVLAFEPQAMAGGIAGVTVQQAMRFGVARGLFSNEAGLGSTPHAHALAKVKRPQDQGAVAILGVFIDTFVVLTLTGLVLITSGLVPQGLTGTALTQAAFSQAFGGFGPVFIAVCMFFFAFSTIIGWYFFGQSNFKALFGEKLLPVYSVIVVAFILVGSTLKVDLVWALADLFNGLMAIPNLLALLALSGVVVAIDRK